MSPLIITPSDPLGNFLHVVPMVLCSAGLEILFQMESASAKRHNKRSIALEAKTSPGHSGFLMPLILWVKKE